MSSPSVIMQDDPIATTQPGFDPSKGPMQATASAITAAAALGNNQPWPPQSMQQMAASAQSQQPPAAMQQPPTAVHAAVPQQHSPQLPPTAQQQAPQQQAPSGALAAAPLFGGRLQQAAANWSTWFSTATNNVGEAIKTAGSSQSSLTGRPTKLTKGPQGQAATPAEAGPVNHGYVQTVVAAGLQAAMTAMEEASRQRFEEVEANVGGLQDDIMEIRGVINTESRQVHGEIDQVKAEIQRLNDSEAARAADAERVRQESLAVLQELKDVREAAKSAPPPGLAQPSAAWAAGSASAASTAAPGLPHEMRTEAILAGLGYNCTQDQILDRGRQALTAAGIPEDWHHGLTANTRCTAIFIEFKEASQLRLANSKLRRSNLTFAPNTKPWLDARKTRTENKPRRTIHKALEAIQDLNSSITAAGGATPYTSEALVKNMKRLNIQHGENGPTVCYFDPKRAELCWDQRARAAFDGLGRGQDLDQIAAWCSLE